MLLLAYILLSSSAILIAYVDIRKQAIPVWALFIFAMAGFLKQGDSPQLEGFVAAGILALVLLLCQGVFSLTKRTPVMGSGDLVLAPLCGLWLRLNDITPFLFFTGLFSLGIGLVWRSRWGMSTFPMAPAILMGLGFLLGYRLLSQ